MKQLKFIILITVSLFSQAINAQNFKAPRSYTLKVESDYVKYEKEVIQCVNYIEKTPIGSNVERSKALSFLMEWITGSPDVSVAITEKIVFFVEEPELLGAFMGGWTKFVLEHPELNKNLIKCNAAGLISVIKVYELNTVLKRNTKLDEVVSANKEGKLENWVTERLN
jgi:hypothetical protein